MENGRVSYIDITEIAPARDGNPPRVELSMGFGDTEERVIDARSARFHVSLPTPIPWGIIEAIKHALDLLAVGRIAYPEPIPCPQPADTADERTGEAPVFDASESVDDLIANGEPKLVEATGGAAVMPDEEVVDDDE